MLFLIVRVSCRKCFISTCQGTSTKKHTVRRDEVHSLCDLKITRIDPGRPRIHMRNLGPRSRRAFDRVASLLYIMDDGIRPSTHARFVLNARGRDTIQIFGAAGNPIDEGCELLAMLLNGLLEGVELVIEGVLTGACPESEQEVSVGGYGGWDRDSRILMTVSAERSCLDPTVECAYTGCVRLYHCEQPDRGERCSTR